MDKATDAAGIRADDLLAALEEAAALTFDSIQAAFEGAYRDPDQPERESEPEEFTSISIGFEGAVCGDIVLRSGADLAEDLARALLMMEPDEELSESEIHDSLSEFANIIGGVMKTNALDPHGEYALGLPGIMTYAKDTRGERAGSLLYKQARGRLLLEVWVHGDDGSGSEG